jgi:hypothetical protein
MGTQNINKNYQNSIYQFHNEEKVLAQTQRSAENSLHAIRQPFMVDFIWCLGSAQKIYQTKEIKSKKSLYQGAATRLWVVRGSILGRDNKIYILTFWHRSFTFNSNKSPTQCNNFSVYYPDVFKSSTCFERFPAHHQEPNYCSGSLWFYLRIVVTVVLCS